MATRSTTSPWSLKVLVPFWILQALLTLALIGLYIFFAAVTVEDEHRFVLGLYFTAHRAAAAVAYTVVDFLFLGVVVAQMVLYAMERLSPAMMLAMQIYSSAFWTACFVVNVLGIFWIVPWGTESVLDFSFVVAETALAYGLLVYTSVVFARQENAGNRRVEVRKGMVVVDDAQPPVYSAVDAAPGKARV
ncbi:hypothetical protein MBLNU459_g4128t1 [Dothideomycetes sp. NU459]